MENKISVFIGVVSEEKVKTIEVVKKLLEIPGVQKIWELTGSFDLLVFATSTSISDLNSVVESIRACPGIKSETTFLILDSHSR
ncbi:MAG: Lrp/AsnC ligand binding domain-containing protein [Candidatus Anstonellales archaeon]